MRFGVFILLRLLVVGGALCGVGVNAAEAPRAVLGSAEYSASVSQPFGWRGDGSGCFAGATPPTQWSDTKNVRWSVAVGKSYSSPILAGKWVVVTSEPNWIVAVDRETGKQAWKLAITPADLPDAATRKPAGEYEPPKAGSGLAAATPISDGKNIYAAFANGIICAVDLSGKLQWAAYIDAEQNTGYGRSASPLLVGGKLIVHMTNLYAFDPATGKQLWMNADAPSTYGTPAAMKIGDVDLLFTPRGSVVRVDTGKAVADDVARSGTPSPVVRDGVAYFGDVSASAVRLSPAFKDEEIWNAMIPDEVFGSPLITGGLMFVVTGKGDLLVFSTGGKKEQNPLAKPRALFGEVDNDSGVPVAFSSLTLAGKYIFLNSNQGDVVVLEANADAKQVARNKLAEGSGGSPVFSGKRLYLRSGEKLLCIGEE